MIILFITFLTIQYAALISYLQLFSLKRFMNRINIWKCFLGFCVSYCLYWKCCLNRRLGHKIIFKVYKPKPQEVLKITTCFFFTIFYYSSHLLTNILKYVPCFYGVTKALYCEEAPSWMNHTPRRKKKYFQLTKTDRIAENYGRLFRQEIPG